MGQKIAKNHGSFTIFVPFCTSYALPGNMVSDFPGANFNVSGQWRERYGGINPDLTGL